jgi:hypothetical protein
MAKKKTKLEKELQKYLNLDERGLSPQEAFRNEMRKKGFELVDITPHCEFKLGISGSCNDFNEPNQEIYHVQIWYRDQNVANLNGKQVYVIDDDLYAVWVDTTWMDAQVPEADFVLYRKVPIK